MPELRLDRLHTTAAERIRPFFEEVLAQYQEGIHSINVTGTAITEDYDPKHSDVNSIIILKEIDLKFLEVLAPLGKKYRRHKVAAPLIMTPDYIKKSLDVFPIEFLNFRLIHSTVYGEDILNDVEISLQDLRHQCERELKSKLIWLRQGYISSLGDRRILTEGFVSSITGYIPLFRGIITLFGKEPPLRQEEVIRSLSEITGVNTETFQRVYSIKRNRTRPSIEELNTIFEDFYHATERLSRIVDELKI
jgi:hypothetical protein